MADPGQLSSQFLAGRQLGSEELNVETDLIPYFLALEDGTYEMCTVSPVDLYDAMTA